MKFSLGFFTIGVIGLLTGLSSFQKSQEDSKLTVEAVKIVEKVRRDTVTVFIRDTVYTNKKPRKANVLSTPNHEIHNIGEEGKNLGLSGDTNNCSFSFNYENDEIHFAGTVSSNRLIVDSLQIICPIIQDSYGEIRSLSPYVKVRNVGKPNSGILYSW